MVKLMGDALLGGNGFALMIILSITVVFAILGTTLAALNTAVSLYYYARIIKAMFMDAPYVEGGVEPKVGYQLMLGAFSAAILVFGIWWAPIVDWSQRSLTMLRG